MSGLVLLAILSGNNAHAQPYVTAGTKAPTAADSNRVGSQAMARAQRALNAARDALANGDLTARDIRELKQIIADLEEAVRSLSAGQVFLEGKTDENADGVKLAHFKINQAEKDIDAAEANLDNVLERLVVVEEIAFQLPGLAHAVGLTFSVGPWLQPPDDLTPAAVFTISPGGVYDVRSQRFGGRLRATYTRMLGTPGFAGKGTATFMWFAPRGPFYAGAGAGWTVAGMALHPETGRRQKQLQAGVLSAEIGGMTQDRVASFRLFAEVMPGAGADIDTDYVHYITAPFLLGAGVDIPFGKIVDVEPPTAWTSSTSSL